MRKNRQRSRLLDTTDIPDVIVSATFVYDGIVDGGKDGRKGRLGVSSVWNG